MQIAKLDRDRLTELINIGYGRAADSLSKLVGKRIVLNAPTVELHAMQHLSQALVKLVGKEVSSVHQIFSGAVGGHALLLLNHQSADVLTALLLKDAKVEDRRAAGREALTEMGNIVLQSAIGICGNMLKLQVGFSVPNVSLEAIDDLLKSIVVGDAELKFALLIDTRFQVADQEVSGYLAVVLGLTSYSLLLTELDKWEGRQIWP